MEYLRYLYTTLLEVYLEMYLQSHFKYRNERKNA